MWIKYSEFKNPRKSMFKILIYVFSFSVVIVAETELQITSDSVSPILSMLVTGAGLLVLNLYRVGAPGWLRLLSIQLQLRS